jgi:hypothetical protein
MALNSGRKKQLIRGSLPMTLPEKTDRVVLKKEILET